MFKIIVLILTLVGFISTVAISPRRDSFDVVKSVGFWQHESLLAIHEAEQARKLYGRNLRSIAIHMKNTCQAHFGWDFHCIAAYEKPVIVFWYFQKYIFLKSDTSDNLQILCIKVVRGSTALVENF